MPIESGGLTSRTQVTKSPAPYDSTQSNPATTDTMQTDPTTNALKTPGPLTQTDAVKDVLKTPMPYNQVQTNQPTFATLLTPQDMDNNSDDGVTFKGDLGALVSKANPHRATDGSYTTQANRDPKHDKDKTLQEVQPDANATAAQLAK